MDEDDPWWRDGVCAQIGSDLFFVGKGHSNSEAKAACRMCTVRLKCLADSIKTEVEYGIFGGFTPPARELLSKKVRAGADPLDVAEEAITRERARGTRQPDRRH